jgi:tetratricopeptide (TPR) repeat protein
MKRKIWIIGLFIVLIGGTLFAQAQNELKELEEQKLIIEALKSFIDNDPSAADELEYIIQNREEAARQKANKLLEELAVKDEKAEQQLNLGEIDFISRRLNMALVYFYESKYYLTIQECNQVLRVDPRNALAWIRRGSGYYMLENFDQAKKDWEIALKLNPTNSQEKDIKRYLSKIYQN